MNKNTHSHKYKEEEAESIITAELKGQRQRELERENQEDRTRNNRGILDSNLEQHSPKADATEQHIRNSISKQLQAAFSIEIQSTSNT